ncbi:MAG: cytidine deaminase [Chloroflexi bacterium HGW-Chloroflexi-1]|nr:MAG: cytidine deaminase [Chloroflexi bacterium HGW-Chloroflexi-1]
MGESVTEAEVRELVAAAMTAQQRAYAPYSGFAVGAALRAADGQTYTGCNVENASYGLSICAERNALFHAIAAGQREFEAVAVVTENGVTPCGACRQVLVEFNPQMAVIVADTAGNRRVYSLGDLLLDAFGPEHLGRTKDAKRKT